MSKKQVEAGAPCPVCGVATKAGDESICCADHQSTWTCSGCQANVVGFAFPLRTCPRCGGALSRVERAGTKDDGTIEAIRQAMEIELGGAAFYQEASRRATSAPIRELFDKLAHMEGAHLQQLRTRFHVTDDIDLEGGVGLVARVVYGAEPPEVSTSEDVLKLAYHMECRAREFFVEERDRLSVGSPCREMYSEFAAEEAEHIAILLAQLGTAAPKPRPERRRA